MTTPGGRTAAVLVLALAAACACAPYTGRLDEVDAPDPEATARADQAVASYRRGIRPASDPATVARVERVTHTLLDAAKTGPAGDRTRSIRWEITVVDSPDANVASFPNGTLFVDRGLA